MPPIAPLPHNTAWHRVLSLAYLASHTETPRALKSPLSASSSRLKLVAVASCFLLVAATALPDTMKIEPGPGAQAEGVDPYAPSYQANYHPYKTKGGAKQETPKCCPCQPAQSIGGPDLDWTPKGPSAKSGLLGAVMGSFGIHRRRLLEQGGQKFVGGAGMAAMGGKVGGAPGAGGGSSKPLVEQLEPITYKPWKKEGDGPQKLSGKVGERGFGKEGSDFLKAIGNCCACPEPLNLPEMDEEPAPPGGAKGGAGASKKDKKYNGQRVPMPIAQKQEGPKGIFGPMETIGH